MYDPSQERTWERETDGVHEKPDGDDEHTRSGGHVERAFEDPSAQEADHDEYDSEDQKEAFVHSVSDSSISNERNSAPTGANETVTEKNKKAKDPLGDATCSFSSFWNRMWRFITGANERERREAFVCDQDKKVKEIMEWFERHSLPDIHNGCDCGNKREESDNPRKTL